MNTAIIILSVSLFGILISYYSWRIARVRSSIKRDKSKVKKLQINDQKVISKTKLFMLTYDEQQEEQRKLKAANAGAYVAKKYTNRRQSLSQVIEDKIYKVVKNPFNSWSAKKLVTLCLATAVGGAAVGTIIGSNVFTTVLAMLILGFAGLVTPYTFCSLSIVNNQLRIQESNSRILMTHLSKAHTTKNLQESLRACLGTIQRGTREYDILSSAVSTASTGASASVIINQLKRDMYADDDPDVKQYWDTCYTVEKEGDDLKGALDYIPRRLQTVIAENSLLTKTCLYGYIGYMAGYALILLIIGFFKVAQPDLFFYYVSSPVGNMGLILCLLIMSIFGMILGKLCKIITLSGSSVKISQREEDY